MMVERPPMEEAPVEAIPMEEDRVGVSRAENAWERRPKPTENVVER